MSARARASEFPEEMEDSFKKNERSKKGLCERGAGQASARRENRRERQEEQKKRQTPKPEQGQFHDLLILSLHCSFFPFFLSSPLFFSLFLSSKPLVSYQHHEHAPSRPSSPLAAPRRASAVRHTLFFRSLWHLSMAPTVSLVHLFSCLSVYRPG